jgi:short-subunit dehydrogenase
LNERPLKPSAIIIGASSGIGFELTRYLAGQGYRLGISARRKILLEEQAAALPQVCCVRAMDVSQPEEAGKIFAEMLKELAPVDFVYICAGTGHPNPDLRWELEDETIRVNALGFAALAGSAWNFFLKQGKGHLVGITSVAAVCGSATAPAYGATKIFKSNYLEALRFRALKINLPIYVTEIRPGFVDTAMMKTARPFWVASSATAARQIVSAVAARKSVAYVTRRWLLLAWLLQLLPGRLVAKFA